MRCLGVCVAACMCIHELYIGSCLAAAHISGTGESTSSRLSSRGLDCMHYACMHARAWACAWAWCFVAWHVQEWHEPSDKVVPEASAIVEQPPEEAPVLITPPKSSMAWLLQNRLVIIYIYTHIYTYYIYISSNCIIYIYIADRVSSCICMHSIYIYVYVRVYTHMYTYYTFNILPVCES